MVRYRGLTCQGFQDLGLFIQLSPTRASFPQASHEDGCTDTVQSGDDGMYHADPCSYFYVRLAAAWINVHVADRSQVLGYAQGTDDLKACVPHGVCFDGASSVLAVVISRTCSSLFLREPNSGVCSQGGHRLQSIGSSGGNKTDFHKFVKSVLNCGGGGDLFIFPRG